MLAPVSEAEFGEEALLALNLESRGMWPGFAAELEELTGSPTGYGDPGAWWWPPTATMPSTCAGCTTSSSRLGWTPSGWVRARRAPLEPGLSPRIGGAISRRRTPRWIRAPRCAALAQALVNAGGELRGGTEVRALETDARAGDRRADSRRARRCARVTC